MYEFQKIGSEKSGAKHSALSHQHSASPTVSVFKPFGYG